MRTATTVSSASWMLTALSVSVAHAYLDGPDPWSTGAPGEVDCTDCHETYPLNSGDGSLALLGVPDNYARGQTYRLQVRIEDPGQLVWGFQLTALDGSDSAAGNLSTVQPVETQIVEDTGRQYVMHTAAGNFADTPSGPVTWTFDWTAPGANAGPITFYLAGNAGNNDEEEFKDYIYTVTGLTGAPVSIQQRSWGQVKLQAR